MNRNYEIADSDFIESEKANIKPPFGYFGAKHRLASRIVKCLPPHNAWVEAFCGSAAITLAKKPAPIEIINDMDDQIVNLFQQLRENPEELCRQIALTPYSKAEYSLSRSEIFHTEPLEKARRFLVATMMSVNGAIGGKNSGFSFSQSYTRGNCEARVNRWYNLPERLEKIVERLRRVRIENRDARQLINMFIDRPATLIYMDPPYLMNRSTTYNVDANDSSFHEEMLDICCKSRSMILVSGYDNILYNSILTPKKGWTKIEIDTSTRSTSGKDSYRKEVLWKNKNFTKASQTNKIPIRLNSMEKKYNKINPPRK